MAEQARSLCSDEYLFVYKLEGDTGHLTQSEKQLLVDELERDVKVFGRDVEEWCVDYNGDIVMVYATATEDVWDSVLWTLCHWDVEYRFSERECEIEEPEWEWEPEYAV